jgi:hypothetical protein
VDISFLLYSDSFYRFLFQAATSPSQPKALQMVVDENRRLVSTVETVVTETRWRANENQRLNDRLCEMEQAVSWELTPLVLFCVFFLNKMEGPHSYIYFLLLSAGTKPKS